MQMWLSGLGLEADFESETILSGNFIPLFKECVLWVMVGKVMNVCARSRTP